MAAEKKNVHAGHRKRMRERFLNGGLDNFQPHEVLELLLFEYIPVVNTNPIGHELIERFGSVKNVLTAPYEELVKVPGIGPKAAEGILSVYPIMTNDICDSFRKSGALTRYDLAFLADWFMSGLPNGSVGLILCGHDRRFRDFVRLTVNPENLIFGLSGQIVKAARGMGYYLLVREDYNLVSRESATLIRNITGCGHAYMMDVLVLDGYRPVSVIYDI